MISQTKLEITANPPVELTLVSITVRERYIVYATVSETNFGSVHHITLDSNELAKSLAKIDHGQSDQGSQYSMKSGDVWPNYPHKGFVTIWEVGEARGRNRSVNLTYAQVGLLIDYFFPKQ